MKADWAAPGWSVLLCSVVLSLASCGGGAKKAGADYPPRPVGCEIAVLRGPLPNPKSYERLGGVDVICGNDVNDAKCMRTLMDEACKLGGDTIYELPSEPSRPSPDKVKWEARVAHTRKPPSSP